MHVSKKSEQVCLRRARVLLRDFSERFCLTGTVDGLKQRMQIDLAECELLQFILSEECIHDDSADWAAG